MSFLENCRKFIGIESSPGRGNKDAAQFVGHLCEEAGMHVEYQTETLNGLEQCNVIARPSSSRPPEEILFQTHLDTVQAGNFANWTQTQANPFNASIIDGKIYGLGVADTKLDFLCKLEALKGLKGKNLKLPYVLVGTYGAQSGMAGAVKLVRKKLISSRKALIGEPTDLQLKCAGQGLAVVEISVPFSNEERDYKLQHDLQESSSTQSKMFSGKAAHSSRPQLGENAIVKMLDYLAQLPEGIAVMDLDGGLNYNSVPSSAVLEFDLVGSFKEPIVPKLSAVLQSARRVESQFEVYKDSENGLSPTMNIGMIRTYEDEIRVLGSCRLPPSVPEEIYQKWMAELGEACSNVGAGFRVKDYKKSFAVAKNSSFVSELFKASKEMDLSPDQGLIESATEASVFSRLGVECVLFGPGLGVGNSHAPNEWVRVQDLEKATEFYRRVAERLCI